MRQPGLFLDQISISLHGHRLLSLTQHVAPGDIVTIMGPSGSGKSTLLAYIGGFLDSEFDATGSVFVDGEEITNLPAEDRHAGILFQDPLLFPHMSVGRNLVFAAPPGMGKREDRKQLADGMLDGVGLSGMADRDPDTLSGGQKARVALARVLISAPRMLLLDEPFSKLDAGLRQQMRKLVFGKARDTGLAIVLVTHDQADAEAAGGKIIRIGCE